MPSTSVEVRRRADAAYKQRQRAGRMVRLFPVEPLREAMRAAGVSENELRRAGVTIRFSRGRCTWTMGDRAACAMGLHPADIWPDLWGAYEQPAEMAS